MAQPSGKRTTVYIDGYNLYYGRLRGTAYKWLDVVELFKRILKVQDPSAELIKVRYFSAPALGRFASHGVESTIAQDTYHRALLAKHGALFELKLGLHSYERQGVKMPLFVDGEAYDRAKTARVWHLVEKKTDVNLALTIYRDACAGRIDQIVLCSNDSDAEPALEALRNDFPNITVGLVSPARPRDGEKSRRTSASLSNLAHWTRHHIRDDELAFAALPEKVPTNKKPAVKPKHW